MRAKSKSSYGLDEIPYNVLKYPVVFETLRHLFQHFFLYSHYSVSVAESDNLSGSEESYIR